jgi:ABC-2 type transport system permease protein
MSVALPRPRATVATAPMRAPWARIALYAVRRRKMAVLVWGLPLGALAAMVVAIFPSIGANPQLSELLDSYPEAVKQAFGITDASFASAEGYLAAELFSLIAPFACCAFIVHGLAVALAGAEQRATLDVVLSAPLSRRQYLIGWLVGLAVTLLGILGVLAVTMQLAAAVFGVDLAVASTLAGVLNLWPLAVFSGGLAAVLCGAMTGAGPITGAAIGILVAMYFVEVLGRVSDSVASVDVVSAFHYYGSAIENGIDAGAFIGITAVGVALAALGCLLFERRDLRR